MKKYLGLFTAALLFTFSGVSFAATVPSSGSTTAIDLSALPQDQQDAIRQQVADAKKAASPVAQVQAVTDAASKWVEIGHAVGSTLVSTAQDLGVTANQFATTPVGKIIVAIVVWKYLAADITHIGMGILFLALGIILGLNFLRRATLRKVSGEEWSHTPVLWGLFTRRKLIRRDYDIAGSLKSSEQTMQVAGYLCLAIGVVICLFLI
jgi:hypothetical protein